MKKLCNGKGRRVHPAPPPPAARSHLLALPVAVLALAATLAPEEQEVLAYLLTGGVGGADGRRWRQHPPELGCGCFGCYKSFWARWDASPNSHVIHRIIEAVEEGAEMKERGRRSGGRRRRRSSQKGGDLEVAEEETKAAAAAAAATAEGGNYAAEDDEDGGEEDGEEINGGADSSNSNSGIDTKNSVRRLVSFLGERVWGAWN